MSRTYCDSGEKKSVLLNDQVRKQQKWDVKLIFPMMVIIGLSIYLFGCAHRTPGTYQHTETDFSKTGKIAIIKFNDAELGNAGQEAADLLALAFTQKGYSVVDVSNILSLSDQEKLYGGVLTSEIKAKFRHHGVGSIVMGNITDYSCKSFTSWFLSLFQIDVYRTYCRVAVTVRMIKLETGEILWGVSRSEEDAGSDINAGMVLRSLVQGLEHELPVDPTKQPAK